MVSAVSTELALRFEWLCRWHFANAQAHVWLAQQPLASVARPDVLAYYRALQQPVLNLGGVLVSLSDGLSFCFYDKRLTWIYWSARQSSNGVA